MFIIFNTNDRIIKDKEKLGFISFTRFSNCLTKLKLKWSDSMEINIPPYVQNIIKKLEDQGHKAYIVGGAVRNILLGERPVDFDISTSARPDEVENIFAAYNPIPIGKEFGTILVPQKGGNIEITTFRVEGDYRDGRKPDWVEFSSNIIDDLSRRDFTINAMAYNEETGLIDPFNGREDLKRKTIKTVGEPEERFKEDYLRILRAVRFSTQLEFKIDAKTFNSGKKYAREISKISRERVREEFFKIILSEKPSWGLRLLHKIGLLKEIVAELETTIGFNQKTPHHELELFDHILCVVDNVPPILNLRLAALFHDLGKPKTQTIDKKGMARYYNHAKVSGELTEKILRRLKVSNKLIKETKILVLEHMNHHNQFSEKGLRRLIRRMGEEEIFNLFHLQKADIKCSNKDATINHIIERKRKVREIIKNKDATTTKELAIDGHDLIGLGFSEGKIIGEILEYLLDKVMEEPKLNKKDKLKKLAKDYKGL